MAACEAVAPGPPLLPVSQTVKTQSMSSRGHVGTMIYLTSDDMVTYGDRFGVTLPVTHDQQPSHTLYSKSG